MNTQQPLHNLQQLSLFSVPVTRLSLWRGLSAVFRAAASGASWSCPGLSSRCGPRALPAALRPSAAAALGLRALWAAPPGSTLLSVMSDPAWLQGLTSLLPSPEGHLRQVSHQSVNIG